MKKIISLFIGLSFLFCSNINAQQVAKHIKDILNAMHEQLINKPSIEEFENSELAQMFQEKQVHNNTIIMTTQGSIRESGMIGGFKEVLICIFDEQQKKITSFTYEVGPTLFYGAVANAFSNTMNEIGYQAQLGKNFVGKDRGRNQAYKHKDWKFSGVLTNNDDNRTMKFGVSRIPEAGDKKAQEVYEQKYWKEEPILREEKRKLAEEQQRKVEKIANNLFLLKENLRKKVKNTILDYHLLKYEDNRFSETVLGYVDTIGYKLIKVRDSIIDNELFQKLKYANNISIYEPYWNEECDGKLLKIAQENDINTLYGYNDGVFFSTRINLSFSKKSYKFEIRKSKKGISYINIKIEGDMLPDAVNMLPDSLKQWIHTTIKENGHYYIDCVLAEEREMLQVLVYKSTALSFTKIYDFKKR